MANNIKNISCIYLPEKQQYYDIKDKIARNLAYNVKAYGAVGDGITDDRAAIQAALDDSHASGGGMIYFPPGKYLINANSEASFGADGPGLRFYSNQILYGVGATLIAGQQDTDAWAPMNNIMQNDNRAHIGGYAAVQNSIICGLTFDGNRDDRPSDQACTLLGVGHGNNIKIINCTFQNTTQTWHNIEINASVYTTIKDCLFDNQGGTNPNGCIIQVDSHNNMATWPWTGNWFDSTPSDHTLITNNRFICDSRLQQTNDFGVSTAIGNHSEMAVRNTIIENNTFINNHSSRGTICFQSSYHTIVRNNNFFACQKLYPENSNMIITGNVRDDRLLVDNMIQAYMIHGQSIRIGGLVTTAANNYLDPRRTTRMSYTGLTGIYVRAGQRVILNYPKGNIYQVGVQNVLENEYAKVRSGQDISGAGKIDYGWQGSGASINIQQSGFLWFTIRKINETPFNDTERQQFNFSFDII